MGQHAERNSPACYVMHCVMLLCLGETSSELPHFSSPHLVSQFALIEKLDFLYYLRHGRPSSAYGTSLVQNLTAFTDVKSQ